MSLMPLRGTDRVAADRMVNVMPEVQEVCEDVIAFGHAKWSLACVKWSTSTTGTAPWLAA